jgi:hypothetical protein
MNIAAVISADQAKIKEKSIMDKFASVRLCEKNFLPQRR